MQSAEAKLYSNSNWPVNKNPKPIGMYDEKKMTTMICPVMACRGLRGWGVGGWGVGGFYYLTGSVMFSMVTVPQNDKFR